MTVHVQQTSAGSLTFDVGDVFDTVDATTIHEALASSGPCVGATVAFHHARRCEPLAVALLSKDILARERVVVLGMCQHERRLLAYLGLSERELASRVPPRRRVASGRVDVLSRQGDTR